MKSFTWNVTFSPDGRLLSVTGSAEQNSWLNELPNGVQRVLERVVGIKVKSSGAVLALDATTGRLRASASGVAYPIVRMAFSSDGRTLATADGNTVQLWEVARLK